MRYPIFTYNDGTEVTASKLTQTNSLRIYTEKWDDSADAFIFAEISLPDGEILSSSGYTDEELRKMKNRYLTLSEDIISYVREKEKQIA